MEFGFVIESVAPGLYGMNPGGKVVSLDNSACMDPVFTCINCYAGLYQEAA